MIVSIHQPQYIPWLGYFDKIDKADVFVLLDIVQFKKNEWQNRNKIKTAQGWQWLTVPVTYKYQQLINEVGINNSVKWQRKHSQSILSNYKKAAHYEYVKGIFEEVFLEFWRLVSPLNIHVVKKLSTELGINTEIYIASELKDFPQDPDERIIAITKHFGAETYLAGAGGRGYMDLEKYDKNGIEVVFQDFKHPIYDQLFGEFEPFMSVVDVICNHGSSSLSIIRGDG
jgi:hypothetical protein